MKPDTQPSTLDTRHPTLDTSRVDLASIRERLASSRGREYWRCLEELSESEEFQELLKQEFPQQSASWFAGVSRRDFLRLMGASLALAGINACRAAPSDGKIVPYVYQQVYIL